MKSPNIGVPQHEAIIPRDGDSGLGDAQPTAHFSPGNALGPFSTEPRMFRRRHQQWEQQGIARQLLVGRAAARAMANHAHHRRVDWPLGTPRHTDTQMSPLPRRWKSSVQCADLQGGFPASDAQNRLALNHSQRVLIKETTLIPYHRQIVWAWCVRNILQRLWRLNTAGFKRTRSGLPGRLANGTQPPPAETKNAQPSRISTPGNILSGRKGGECQQATFRSSPVLTPRRTGAGCNGKGARLRNPKSRRNWDETV